MTNHAVVLSDVHIGNGAPTVWYQPAVHEPYLLSALQWIVSNASTISEVVLLGDLVDQWTYPPGVQPPSVQQIIDANPNTLGPGGLLAQVVQAVPKTSFLLGNHDGQISPADIAALQASIGPFTVEDPVYLVESSTGARTVFSHGHLWTMFNAPDTATSLAPLPVGHYVTRAFSYMMANRLQPGQTVADLPNMGYPDGFNIWQFLQSLSPTLDPDIADMLLDYCASTAQMDENLPVVLPDGSTSSIASAKTVFANLFSQWVAAEGSITNAARAALADGSPPYLAWFAQRLAIQQSADLVVMGHTHQPVSGLSISPIDYVNSGFECASAPDNPPKAFNFTVVDLDTASAQIQQVNPGTYAVVTSSAPPMSSAILSPALDYSSYVRIYNQTSKTLTLSGTSAGEGSWVVPPTASIPPGGRGDGWLQDNPGPLGTSGGFTYTPQGGAALQFSASCPTGFSSNAASGPGNNFIARSGSGAWQGKGQVPWMGHPLQVQFTITGS